MTPQSLGHKSLALAAIGAVLIATPLIFNSNYQLGVLIFAGGLAISATGMVLMFGLAHQLVLGQAVFCLIGAYGSGLMTTRLGWDPLLALLLSAVLAMGAAYLIGRPILRLRGFVLAMASLAVQLVVISAATESLGLTGGAMGLTGVPHFGVGSWRIESSLTMVYVMWGTVCLAVFFSWNIARSRIGRGLRAIASSEAGAASIGIDIPKLKVDMFVVSAAFASIAGSLIVHYLRIVEPQIFNLTYGFSMLTAVIIGGLVSPWGGVVGALVITLFRELLKYVGMPSVEILIMGSLTVLALLLMPAGIIGTIKGALRRESARRRATEAPPVLEGNAGLPRSEAGQVSASHEPILRIKGLGVAFGSLKAVDDVSFDVPRGTITALVGPNGAGKTTTFNLLCGYLPCSSGVVTLNGRQIEQADVDQISRLGVGRTFQLIQLFSGMTVLENVMAGRHRFLRAPLASIMFGMRTVRDEEAGARETAMRCLDFVGLAHLANAHPEELAFGQQRQVELARALATEPTLLVMDEPASGLNDSETEALAGLILKIRGAGVTVLLVEHDMRLVMGLADHIVVMDRGQKIEEGDPQRVRSSRAVIDAYLSGSPA